MVFKREKQGRRIVTSKPHFAEHDQAATHSCLSGSLLFDGMIQSHFFASAPSPIIQLIYRNLVPRFTAANRIQ